ncbi:DNA translocase FtsK [Pseudomonas sp. P66]|uniref:DNA translocase FtsK n=1 Tax=Pseudomonas arcuscaelestis TaxID=2710591 RepID=A0ABS2C301_9PSED|nr:DNA translocase FtsK [Pseudomonas arcuscaelestis]MBM5460254.1 DNA translocase FtsK [Pseudomonas arcuscaelestis]
MKVEHREAIERAKLHGVEPMVLAHQLMVHDLVGAALFELRNTKTPFGRLSEEDQQEVIDRITEQAEEAVTTAVGIISSRSVCTIPFKVADSKFKEKSITVTGIVDAQDPNRAGLVDLSGKLVMMVLAPNDYNEGKDGIRAERDQRELPLSAGAIAEAMYRDRRNTPMQEDEPEAQAVDLDPTPQTAPATGDVAISKEFGDFDYDDAKQLIVLKASGKPFKAHWVQSRLAVSSEQATTLLLRLLDDQVITVETEGETALDHSYKVSATLEEVVA